MKRIIYLLSFLILSSASVFAAAQSTNTTPGVLQVTITGFTDTNGTIRLAIWNSPESYTDSDKAVYKVEKIPVMPSVTFVITNLANGVYAAGVYHDRNGNKLMDKNILGKPVERYGISNNAHGMFGPARYQKAKFTLDSKGKTLKISLK